MPQHLEEEALHVDRVSRYPEEGAVQSSPGGKGKGLVSKGKVQLTETRRLGIWRSNEDCLARYSVHEDTCAALQIVKVDEAVFGDEVDDAVLLRNLHSNWEIVNCLGWEVDVYCLLGKYWVRGLVVDLDNVQLCAGGSSNRKSEHLCI